MVSTQDKDILADIVFEEADAKFQVKKEGILTQERIIFGDFMNGIESENRPYQLVEDLNLMVKKIEEYLEDYN
jgi:F420-0:gamma-glutamyl ligase